MLLLPSVEAHLLFLEPDHLLEKRPGFRLRHALKSRLPQLEPEDGPGPVQLHPVLLEGHHDTLKGRRLLRAEFQPSPDHLPESGVKPLLQVHPVPLPSGGRGGLCRGQGRDQGE